MSTRPLKICVVALNAYPAIDALVPGGIGGIETRSWAFARGLASREDCDVTFIVRHEQPLRQSAYHGVQVRLLRDRTYSVRESLAVRLQRQTRFPWVTLKQPRLADAFYLPYFAIQRLLAGKRDSRKSTSFFRRMDADVFLTFGVQGNSATVIASAQSRKRPAVLCLGSDYDLDDRYLAPSGTLNTYHDSDVVCRWIIDSANAILCQTEAQQARLEAFGRSGICLPNPIDLVEWDRLLDTPLANPIFDLSRFVLWIGRAENVYKRPDICLELARLCPDIPFVMILNRRDDAVEASIRREAPPNVTMIERVPFPRIPQLMRYATMLVNTSTREGFPNTFLQAAATRTPIVSLNVENDFLETSRAGACAKGNLNRMAEQVQLWWKTPPSQEELTYARHYVEEHHSLISLSEKLAQVLREVCREYSAQTK
ncbi:MAG TPA: glycosyltransferase family 4 protein [Planctomicrobium sp.]|nr:glycosyltransferase family 4 protein [Planctomicrobium sp.]